MLIGKGEGRRDIGLLRESKEFLRKMNGLPEAYMGNMIVCDKVFLGVVLTLNLLSWYKSQSLLLIKLLQREFMTIEFFLEDLSLG